MTRTTRATGRRRLASLSLLAVIGLALAGPSSAVATTAPPVSAAEISAAESAMVAALNADRKALGLVAVKIDTRLMAIARARSLSWRR